MQIVQIPSVLSRALVMLDTQVMEPTAQISTSAAWNRIFVTQKEHVSTLRVCIFASATAVMKTLSMVFHALTLTSVLLESILAWKMLIVPIMMGHSLALAKPAILVTELSALT